MNDIRRGLAAVTEEGLEEVSSRFSRRAESEGLFDVAFSSIDSPLGALLMAVTRRGLVRIAYQDESADLVLTELAEQLSPRVLEAPERLERERRQIEEYFEGGRRRFEFPIDWSLSSGFRLRVLRATAAIPFGAVSSYRGVAEKAGSPRGARAAGNALGRNPIPVVVPCHRVIRTGGDLGGYTGGLSRKVFLLELERAPRRGRSDPIS